MTERPLSVTIVSCLFLAAGVIGLAYHLSEFNAEHPFQNGAVWVWLVRILAIVGGVYMLRGRNWARWLTVVWIAFHVIVSAFHSVSEVAVHAALLAVFAYFLFRRPANGYFRPAGTETT